MGTTAAAVLVAQAFARVAAKEFRDVVGALTEVNQSVAPLAEALKNAELAGRFDEVATLAAGIEALYREAAAPLPSSQRLVMESFAAFWEHKAEAASSRAAAAASESAGNDERPPGAQAPATGRSAIADQPVRPFINATVPEARHFSRSIENQGAGKAALRSSGHNQKPER